MAARVATDSAVVTNCSTNKMVMPAAGQAVHHLVELAHDEWGQPHGQLVEQQHGGIGDQGPGDGQHLLLPSGEGPGHLLPPFLQPGKGGKGLLLDITGDQATAVGPDAEVLPYRQIGEDPTALGNGAQSGADQLFGGALPHRLVADEHLPRGRPHATADHLEQRRLPGAVGAEQGEHAPRRHHQVDTVEDLDPPVGRPDAVDGDARGDAAGRPLAAVDRCRAEVAHRSVPSPVPVTAPGTGVVVDGAWPR